MFLRSTREHMVLAIEFDNCEHNYFQVYLPWSPLVTTDNILVYNLFIYDLPENANARKIKRYFEENFGEVLKVRLIRKRKTHKCIAYFADPKDAARVLQEKCHILMDSIIRIEPCHGINQPDGCKFLKILDQLLVTGPTTTQSTKSNETEGECLILNLNDDCLENICKYLTHYDRINFALTCQRLYSVMLMFSRIHYPYMITDTFNEWPLLKTRTFLQIVGPQIIDLEINLVSDKSIFDMLASFCKNVLRLTMDVYFGIPVLVKLLESMPILQELDIPRTEFTDDFVTYLSKHNELNKLVLEFNYNITGKYIYHLYNLEKLCLNECPRLEPKYFQQICINLIYLRELDIRNCELLTRDDFEHISKHLVNLTILKMSVINENFDCIAQLPLLCKLEIIAHNEILIPDRFFKSLAAYKANDLKELTLECAGYASLEKAAALGEFKILSNLKCTCLDINDEYMKKIIQLKELEELHLESCSNVTNETVLKLFETCHYLDNVTLRQCDYLTPELISKLVGLLTAQKDKGIRTQCVKLCLGFLYFHENVDVFKSFDIPSNILTLHVRCSYEEPEEFGDDNHSEGSDDIDFF